MECFIAVAHIEVATKVFNQFACHLLKGNRIWVKIHKNKSAPFGDLCLRQTRIGLLPHLREIPFGWQLDKFAVEVPAPSVKWTAE